jgi:hypothetical protein
MGVLEKGLELLRCWSEQIQLNIADGAMDLIGCHEGNRLGEAGTRAALPMHFLASIEPDIVTAIGSADVVTAHVLAADVGLSRLDSEDWSSEEKSSENGFDQVSRWSKG